MHSKTHSICRDGVFAAFNVSWATLRCWNHKLLMCSHSATLHSETPSISDFFQINRSIWCDNRTKLYHNYSTAPFIVILHSINSFSSTHKSSAVCLGNHDLGDRKCSSLEGMLSILCHSICLHYSSLLYLFCIGLYILWMYRLQYNGPWQDTNITETSIWYLHLHLILKFIVSYFIICMFLPNQM